MADADLYGSSWYADDAVAAPERGRLTFDLDVDVGVIGGGLAGLTAAREIARRGWSVAVLEARRVAWNASGRNGGLVRPGFAQPIERIVARVGLAHAGRLWRLSERGADYVRRTIEETAMPGVAPVPGHLDVSRSDNGDAAVERLRLLGEEIGAEVEAWPAERVREVLRSPRYFHALHYPRAFHVHALNYAFGLAAAAEAAGVRIFEETPALSIDPAGVRKRVATPSARLRAAHIVLAGGPHLGAVMPRVATTVLPIATYSVTTAPLGERLAQAMAFRGSVSDGDWTGSRYRIVGGDRLQWSGRATAWISDPRRIARGLKADIARIYPQLGAVEVAHAWQGLLGVTVHGMPQIGELAPGVWLAGGFGDHGLNTAAMAGELIARAVVEGDQAWRLFLPYELVWAGGALGRMVTQGLYWGARVADFAEARMARRREAARRRAAARARRISQVVGPLVAPVHMTEPAFASPLAPADEPAAAAPRRRKQRSENLVNGDKGQRAAARRRKRDGGSGATTMEPALDAPAAADRGGSARSADPHSA